MQKWAPWALSQLQPWKKLVGIITNVLVFLFLAQFLGVDIGEVTQGKVVPPVPWYGTLGLAVVFLAVEIRISNQQEIEKRKKAETAPPPAE